MIAIPSGMRITAFDLVDRIQHPDAGDQEIRAAHFFGLRPFLVTQGLLVLPDPYDPTPCICPDPIDGCLFFPHSFSLPPRIEHLFIGIRECFPGMPFQLIEISIGHHVMTIRKMDF